MDRGERGRPTVALLLEQPWLRALTAQSRYGGRSLMPKNSKQFSH